MFACNNFAAAIDPIIQTHGGANGVYLDHIGRKTLSGFKQALRGKREAAMDRYIFGSLDKKCSIFVNNKDRRWHQ